MRCKSCDYSLWNLRDRKCPECGKPFAPSEFEFVPGAVRFCCPQCNQEYYGTSPQGHLVPRSFTCVKCDSPVQMDAMVLLPAEGYSEEQTAAATNPWLVKGQPLLRKWMRTIGMSLAHPGQLIDGTPLESSRGSAWKFALLTNVAAIGIGVGLWSVLQAGMMAAMGAGGAGAPGAGILLVSMLGCGLLGGVVGFFVFAFLWAAMAHVLLLLTGGGTRGFVRTLQVILYSSGANAIGAVPCLGFYVSWIWWAVSAAIMLKRGHRIGGARAALAACAAPVCLVVVGVGLLLFPVMMTARTAAAAAAAGGAGPGAPGAGGQFAFADSSSREVVASMTRALQARARSEGAWPQHAAELLNIGLTPDAFVGPISPTQPSDVTAAGESLQALQEADRAERTLALDSIAAAMPEDVVAHRVGDFVFTYHGAPVEADGRLWLVIQSPAPSELSAPGEIVVGVADGSTRVYPAVALPAILEGQNAVRAELGMPPLWHPDFVSEVEPQAAGDGG